MTGPGQGLGASEELALILEDLAADIRAGRIEVTSSHANEADVFELGAPTATVAGRIGKLSAAWFRASVQGSAGKEE